MTSQREKDEYAGNDRSWAFAGGQCRAFADGAEYARTEVAAKLRKYYEARHWLSVVALIEELEAP